MTTPRQERDQWAGLLKEHLLLCREETPIPARATLTARQELQCRCLGGHLIHWLEDWGPRLIQERNALLPPKQPAERQPLVIIATDVPGLVACAEILGGQGGQVIFGGHEEIRAFEARHPDPGFDLHCTLETWFEEPSTEELAALAARHPGRAAEALAVHRECAILGPLFARGGRHLWDLGGDDARLVAEAFETWVS